jgi:hypothetical protein
MNAFIPCNSFFSSNEAMINEIGKWLKPLFDLVGISKGAGLNPHLWNVTMLNVVPVERQFQYQ